MQDAWGVCKASYVFLEWYSYAGYAAYVRYARYARYPRYASYAFCCSV
jgi:hypothetical protein